MKKLVDDPSVDVEALVEALPEFAPPVDMTIERAGSNVTITFSEPVKVVSLSKDTTLYLAKQMARVALGP